MAKWPDKIKNNYFKAKIIEKGSVHNIGKFVCESIPAVIFEFKSQKIALININKGMASTMGKPWTECTFVLGFHLRGDRFSGQVQLIPHYGARAKIQEAIHKQFQKPIEFWGD